MSSCCVLFYVLGRQTRYFAMQNGTKLTLVVRSVGPRVKNATHADKREQHYAQNKRRDRKT